MESNGVRFISLGCIVFELSACENSAEFPAESGCKANDLIRYKVDTARRCSTLYLIEVRVRLKHHENITLCYFKNYLFIL